LQAQGDGEIGGGAAVGVDQRVQHRETAQRRHGEPEAVRPGDSVWRACHDQCGGIV